MVLLFIGMQYRSEGVKQVIKRMPLIFANLIEQLVETVNGMVVVGFVPNTK